MNLLKTLNVILYSYLVVFAILGSMTLFALSLPLVYGQGTPTTPAQTTTIQGASSGNLEFLKQKAFVYTLPPQGENIPQGNTFAAVGGEGGLAGMITGALGIGTAIYSKLTSSTKKTGQENATNTAQLATVSKEGLKLQYETMGTEKANAITGKPEIKVENVAKIETKAIENAAKA